MTSHREDLLTPATEGSKRQDSAPLDGPPAQVAWLGAAATLATIAAAQIWRRESCAWLRPVGALILLVGGVCIVVPFALLRRHGQADRDDAYMSANVVVDRGLYAIVRHPQYLGYVLLACGFAMVARHWAVAALALLSGLCWYLQTVHEERYCLARFGESYSRYARTVPRLNPLRGVLRWLRRRRNADSTSTSPTLRKWPR